MPVPLIITEPAPGGDFHYSKLAANSHAYWYCKQCFVLGLRGDIKSVSDDAPFYDVPFIEIPGIAVI